MATRPSRRGMVSPRWRLSRGSEPALVVLDVMLPEMDGFEVCRKLRAEDNPVLILMLTARDEDIDKIVGLELGADDYMTKPFNPRELVARVKAMLRRVNRPVSDARWQPDPAWRSEDRSGPAGGLGGRENWWNCAPRNLICC